MWSPSVAFTTLAALAALITFGVGALKPNNTDLVPYEVILHKGITGSELDEPLGPYYISDGQCTGVLDDELTCKGGWPPSAVRLTVLDGVAFPLVVLQDSLQRAGVVRQEPCKGSAIIRVHLTCTYITEHPE